MDVATARPPFVRCHLCPASEIKLRRKAKARCFVPWFVCECHENPQPSMQNMWYLLFQGRTISLNGHDRKTGYPKTIMFALCNFWKLHTTTSFNNLGDFIQKTRASMGYPALTLNLGGPGRPFFKKRPERHVFESLARSRARKSGWGV